MNAPCCIKWLSALAIFTLPTFSVFANMDEIPDIDANKSRGFTGLVGAGVMSIPDYAGGSENEVHAIPLINVSYNDNYYFKFNRGGWWFWRPKENNFRFGLEVGFRRGWDHEDLEASLEDTFDLSDPQFNEVDNIILVGLNTSLNYGNFNVDVSVMTGSADENYYGEEPGTEMILRASYTLKPLKNVTVTASTRIEALSEDTVNYLYGVNGYQGEFATNVGLNVIGTYRFANNWLVMGGAGVTLLSDEIADSPIVADDSQTLALVGIGYTF